jgi:protocatechuate 3,4-dioxygenase beta subunit
MEPGKESDMKVFDNTMANEGPSCSRRGFLTTTAAGIMLFTSGAAFADELLKTPRQTEGPFYPDKLPLDTDNDLIVINDHLTPAIGEVTYLSGRVLDTHGNPIRNATVEIWQVDGKGSYLHTKGANGDNGGQRDGNFQGFGRFITGSTGEYVFRTIKPVPYPGRTPHIHFAIKMKGHEKWTTQCYIKGEPRNATDGVLKDIKDPKALASVMVPFVPMKDSKASELSAKFDIVMGYTPAV